MVCGGESMNQAYSFFAQYYDEIMSTVPYEEWVDYVEKLLKEINYHPKTVLDLACGTGNMALLLAKQGYNVQGIDGSHAMLRVAQQKAAQENLLISFNHGDFRTFRLSESVDLVISLFDSLNYLLNEDDLRQSFKQVYSALCPEGYFIFDLNTIRRLTSIEEGNSMVEGEEYYCFWRDRIDLEGTYWKIELTFFVEQADGNLLREDEVHTERGYPISKVKELLQTSGFKVVHVYDGFTLNPGSEESDRIYIVAKKGD